MGKGAPVTGREGVSHDAGVKAGGDRRHPFRRGQIDQSCPAAEGRQGRQGRGSGHPGSPSHDKHPAVIPLARIPPSDGESGEVNGRGKGRT